jgi:uncharacterized cupredoxin-like copper-binding protein
MSNLILKIAGIVVLMMAACGNQAGKATVVHVKLTEYKVEMDKNSIPAGLVRFEIKNAGTTILEIVLEPASVVDKPFEANGKASEAENIQPGQSATLEWTINDFGQYQLGCHTPGHYEQGMFENFTVIAL